MVGKEGDHFFDGGPGFKNKCAVIYIEHVEYIQESTIREGDGLVAH